MTGPFRSWSFLQRDPLVKKVRALHTNRLITNMDRLPNHIDTVVKGKDQYVLIPSLVFPMVHFSGKLSHKEHRALLTQALELDVYAPDLEEREKLFDQTAEYLRVYIEHFDAMKNYYLQNLNVDTEEECFDDIKAFWDTPEVAEKFRAAFSSCHTTPEFVTSLKNLEKIRNGPRFTEGGNKEKKIIGGSRVYEIDGYAVSAPKRPSLPIEIVEAGIPHEVIRDFQIVYNRFMIVEIHKIFTNRPRGCKYPYQFQTSPAT